MTAPKNHSVTIEVNAREVDALFAIAGRMAARDNSQQARDALKVADRLANAIRNGKASQLEV